MPLQDPMIIHDDNAVLAFLAELERSESGVFAARGGAAPRSWTEDNGAPAQTRGGIPRRYGRVVRLAGAD